MANETLYKFCNIGQFIYCSFNISLLRIKMNFEYFVRLLFFIYKLSSSKIALHKIKRIGRID